MTQMEGPKRKMQKKNDYQRHKLFRKIKRRRKAQAEAEQQIAEKQLRRKLKLPKFGDGKEKVNLDNAHFDKEGNLVDNTTGVKYTPTSDDIVITPNTKYFYDQYASTGNYFDGNWSKDLINMTPGIGDGMDIAQSIVDSTNGKYLTVGSSLAMLALPNFIEKLGRRLINFMPGLTRYLYNANLSDEQLLDLFSQQNGYGKDYQRAYNSADANTKKQMSNKARNMFKLAAIGGVGITTANKVNSDKSYNSGKDIHIKKSKRGTFTKAAKQHGMSVQSFANKVLRNPSKYSAAMMKKANFAHNAASWKH